MNKRTTMLAVIGTIGVLGFALWALSSTPTSDVSIQFCGYETNNLNEVNGRATIHSYVVASCRLTNFSGHSISYYGDLRGEPRCRWMVKTEKGWKDETMNECGFGADYHTLSSNQSTNFTVLVFQPAKPKQVQIHVEYQYHGVIDKVGELLPSWMHWMNSKQIAVITLP